jgi:hypothetical protein
MAWYRTFAALPNGCAFYANGNGPYVKTGSRTQLQPGGTPPSTDPQMTAVPDTSINCVSVDKLFLGSQNAVA